MSTPGILVSGPRRARPPRRGGWPWRRGALRAPLLADPIVLPALAALAVLVSWAASDGGYPQTSWAPGGLILLALLAIAVGVVGLRRHRCSGPVRIAIGALAAYTALSFLSILWAKARAQAWEGADRTLVYLIVFTLMATWRRPGSSAAILLGAWVLAMCGLAIFTALHVDAAAAHPARLRELMPGGRLIYPAGYNNANAAMWMIAAFPALLLASARRVPWGARGLFAGAAVVLSGVALYSQSRGSVYSTPLVLALVFLFLPGRARAFATLVPVAGGVAVLTPAVLRFAERSERGAPVAAAHSATLSVLVAGLGVAAVVAAGAAIESRLRLSDAARARAHRGIAAIGVVVLVAGVAAGLLAIGKPIERVQREWRTFTSQRGYAADEAGTSRLISGLGSGRADFYRVAWHEFLSHPLLGIGADNFAAPYLRLRHSEETPRYPHSVELRTLSQTGVIGGVIALVGLCAALLACARALRAADRLAPPVAGAALAGFAYWAMHGSFDWFFEYAGLGGAAFMLLGLACSLSPRAGAPSKAAGPDLARSLAGPPHAALAEPVGSPAAAGPDLARSLASPPNAARARKRRLRWRRAAIAVPAALITLVAALSLTAPWLSR
ncbi:MAG: O-antigen ligase family protein, partial [Solirubrobacteraceae bacterium]